MYLIGPTNQHLVQLEPPILQWKEHHIIYLLHKVDGSRIQLEKAINILHLQYRKEDLITPTTGAAGTTTPAVSLAASSKPLRENYTHTSLGPTSRVIILAKSFLVCFFFLPKTHGSQKFSQHTTGKISPPDLLG